MIIRIYISHTGIDGVGMALTEALISPDLSPEVEVSPRMFTKGRSNIGSRGNHYDIVISRDETCHGAILPIIEFFSRLHMFNRLKIDAEFSESKNKLRSLSLIIVNKDNTIL